jgi:hypothetical protein
LYIKTRSRVALPWACYWIWYKGNELLLVETSLKQKSLVISVKIYEAFK